jgi:hypothetical protein
MPFVILPTNSASGGYDITNSLRFNEGSSDSLTRTTGTPTSQQKFTCSAWCKRTNIGTFNIIQTFYTDANNYLAFDFLTSDRLDVINYAGATTARKITTAKFRDVSAWYHIVASVDTTLATANDRIKLYVNGTLQTAFDTNTAPSQNANLLTNATTTAIGVGEGGSIGYHNGYISEIYYIDGQALDVTSFGETDFDTGIWKPKAYTGTYGTNGFYLQFKNSASLGTDSSGNGNNFTVNNLTSVDQSTDTPTNNFATLNSILYSTSISYTEGNLKFTNTSSGQRMVASSIAPTTGKWYAECRVTSLGGTYPQIGVLDTSIYTMDTYVGALVRGYGYASHGQVYNNAGALTTGLATYTTNDIIGVALDLDNNYVYFSKNGTFINSGVPTSGSSGTGGWAITDGYDYSFGSSSLDSGTDPVFDWNFGSPFYSGGSNTDGAGFGNFSYAVPSGYYALNTKNLAQFG